MSDLLSDLARINLALAGAVGLVLALRLPARRLFGPRIAYGLWALVPLAVAAMLAPARVVTVAQTWADARPMAAGPVLQDQAAVVATAPFDPALALTVLWIAGALASLAWLVWRQAQFARALAERRAGPAVIGVLRPRVVTPADFAQHYTPKEQLVVLAHEQTHIARQDSRINALVALVRCVNWFNPAIHLLAHYLRIDQEFACDAQVVAAHPKARRAYAEAMLKAQLAARPLPMGCYWPAPSAHPLAQRVRLLSRPTPGLGRRRLGSLAIALLSLGGAWSAWASRPAEVRFVAAAERPWVARAAETRPSAPPAPQAPAAPAMRAAKASIEQTGSAPIPADPTPAMVSTANPDPNPEVRSEDRGDWQPRVRKIHAVARQSAVEPGSAVRLLATMVDRDGKPLVTDLTAYGSQSAYRTGYFRRDGSRYALFTRVRQEGDRLLVTASLDDEFRPDTSGSVVLGSGQTGHISIPGGHEVSVTPTLRPETPEEVAEGQRDSTEREGDRHRGRLRGMWSALKAIPY